MTADELKAKLEAACQDLWWSSESDYPVEVVWRSPQSKSEPEGVSSNEAIATTTVRRLFNHPEDIEIQIAEVADFFERATTPKSWHTEADKAQLLQLQQLKNLLTDELSHLQVYRCGEVEIKVYVLGYAPDSSIAGVQTLLVET